MPKTYTCRHHVHTHKRTIFILDTVLVQLLRHGNVTPREVGVVSHPLRHLHTSRRVTVPGQYGEDIVLEEKREIQSMSMCSNSNRVQVRNLGLNMSGTQTYECMHTHTHTNTHTLTTESSPLDLLLPTLSS